MREILINGNNLHLLAIINVIIEVEEETKSTVSKGEC